MNGIHRHSFQSKEKCLPNIRKYKTLFSRRALVPSHLNGYKSLENSHRLQKGAFSRDASAVILHLLAPSKDYGSFRNYLFNAFKDIINPLCLASGAFKYDESDESYI
jgi:hypothetical protein